jgi:hypothetical protein
VFPDWKGRKRRRTDRLNHDDFNPGFEFTAGDKVDKQPASAFVVAVIEVWQDYVKRFIPEARPHLLFSENILSAKNMSLQHITLDEARHLRRLWNNLHRKLTATEQYYQNIEFNNNNTPIFRVRANIRPTAFRANTREARRVQANLESYIQQLTRTHGVTKRNVHNNFSRYLYGIPGSRITQSNIKRILHLPLTTGNRGQMRPGINETFRNLRSAGIPARNAMRNVLKQTTAAGLRAAVAVRTLQRAFRAKRAAKKNPLHLEMNALRRVPISGIRMNNGNVRPLKPSDIAKARKYLKEQGVRMVIPRSTPRRRAI